LKTCAKKFPLMILVGVLMLKSGME